MTDEHGVSSNPRVGSASESGGRSAERRSSDDPGVHVRQINEVHKGFFGWVQAAEGGTEGSPHAI